MIRRTFQRALQATRPPEPRRTINAMELPVATPSVAVSLARSLPSALGGLQLDLNRPVLLIPDQRDAGMPGSRVTDAVVRMLVAPGSISLGLPALLTTVERRRWRGLAETAGIDVVTLGASGWDRIMLGDRSSILDAVDLPAELYDDVTVVALTTPAGAGAAGVWTEFVHPNTRLRARVVEHGAIELAAAVDARYLMAGQFGTTWYAAIAAPVIVAEVLARAIERHHERSRGLEAPGPWEDAGVQHLAGLVPTGQNPYHLVLRTSLQDNADASLAQQISEMLDWPLSFADDKEDQAGEAR
ncbi:MAG TPA: hypothetical protein VFV93_01825 [Thermomicrobiales bacterium]|nr:hypothetical protein [Thermomicrobiales bacterium]